MHFRRILHEKADISSKSRDGTIRTDQQDMRHTMSGSMARRNQVATFSHYETEKAVQTEAARRIFVVSISLKCMYLRVDTAQGNGEFGYSFSSWGKPREVTKKNYMENLNPNTENFEVLKIRSLWEDDSMIFCSKF